MGALNQSPNMVLKGLRDSFMEGVQNTQARLVGRLAQKIDSDAESEKYVYPTAVSFMRSWDDERVPTNIDALLTYTITNQTYELSLKIKGDLIRDSKAFQFSDMLREAGMRGSQHPDYLLSQLANNSATSGYIAYDGNVFHSDTHVFAGNTAATNIDNKLAGSGTTVAQIQTDFAAAEAALDTYKDDKGGSLNIPERGPNALIIHAHPNLKANFETVLNSTIISNTSNQLVGAADLILDAQLTDTNDWTLNRVNMPIKPYIFQEREALQAETLGFDSEEYKKTGYVWVVARSRFKVAYNAFYRSVRTVN